MKSYLLKNGVKEKLNPDVLLAAALQTYPATNGVIDGIPAAFLDKQYIIPYLQLVHKEMEAINKDSSDIRNYGGTSQIEFLAVAGEYFFERPKLFQRKHPELYKMLDACFMRS